MVGGLRTKHFVIVLAVLGGGFFLSRFYTACTHVNRSLTHAVHPETGQPVTFLTLDGFDDDVVYVIPRPYETLELPEEDYLMLHNSFAVVAEEDHWAVYSFDTEEAVRENELSEPEQFRFESLSRSEYRERGMFERSDYAYRSLW